MLYNAIITYVDLTLKIHSTFYQWDYQSSADSTHWT